MTGKLCFTSRVCRGDKFLLLFTACGAGERTYVGCVDLHGDESFEAVYDHHHQPMHHRSLRHRIHADEIKGNLQRFADTHPVP